VNDFRTTTLFVGKREEEEREREKKAERRERNEPLSGAVLLRDEVVVVSQLRLRELLRHRHRFFLFNQPKESGFVLCCHLCCGFGRRRSPSQKKRKTKSELNPKLKFFSRS
jgi:hypothetical protein